MLTDQLACPISPRQSELDGTCEAQINCTVMHKSDLDWERETLGVMMHGMVRDVKCRYQSGYRLLRCLCACALFAMLQPCAQAQNPRPLDVEDTAQNARAVGRYAQADIAYGAQIFKAQCTPCHGENGDAIGGLNFRAGQFKRVTTDNELRNIINNGVPGTAMAAWHFDESELAGLVAFLRSMPTFDASTIKVGDAAHGQTLFEGTGQCSSCHRVNGKGPRVAPDLSNIGAIRTPDLLQRTLLDPDASLLPLNRTVHAVTKDGKVITGRRLNEDTYSIQIIDPQEHLVSLVKADLREYGFTKTSGMPSYKDKLSSKDIADLTAYLLSLKGSQ
jgi:putative heme-binding domain-containing protein